MLLVHNVFYPLMLVFIYKPSGSLFPYSRFVFSKQGPLLACGSARVGHEGDMKVRELLLAVLRTLQRSIHGFQVSNEVALLTTATDCAFSHVWRVVLACSPLCHELCHRYGQVGLKVLRGNICRTD